MGDHSPNTLWNPQGAEPLRRPSMQLNPRNANHTKGQEKRNSADLTNSLSNLDIANSSLSVAAPEWFPPNYKENSHNLQLANHNPAQDRLKRIKQKFNPETSDAKNTTDENITKSEEHDDTHEVECSALHLLDDLMEKLIVSPADFHKILGAFIETMSPYFEHFPLINCVTDLIVEKVLNEPNFRYSAVRLCVVLQVECGMFRSALCCLCTKKMKQSNDHNLTLLLAELYVQLNYDSIYADLLISSLVRILDSDDGNNVKAACQVLKLTGFALEVAHKDKIDNICTKLRAAREHQILSIKNLIDSVLSLREHNWGRTLNNINVTNNSNRDEITTHDGPIYYGPDGQELTEEEHQFLDDNCSNHSDLYSSDPFDEDWWDPEMTDEMRDAYEEFINNGI